MNGTLSYKVETVINSEERRIIQSLLDDQRKIVSRWIYDTKEKGIKEALIKLGWTPPKD